MRKCCSLCLLRAILPVLAFLSVIVSRAQVVVSHPVPGRIITAGEPAGNTALARTNSAVDFSVARDTVICNNAIAALAVESNLANFTSYTWSPASGLFTDAGATTPYTGGSATTLYVKSSTAGLFQYTVTANNSVTSATAVDVVKVIVLPATMNVSATMTQLCTGGVSTLSVPAAEYGSKLRWYSSPDGIGYFPIPGATTNTYATPALTSTTYYKAEVTNGAGDVCLQSAITINVGMPQILATEPFTRCDPGTVTLGATAGPAGATVNWYAAPSGGTPIATGNSFTTPVLNATTTYYAAAGYGYASTNTGRLAPQAGAGTSLSTYGQDFTITQATRLNSVDVISTTGTVITVSLYNNTGATQLQTTGAVTVPTNSTSTITLGWTLAPGTYRLVANSMTGDFIRENTTVTYPIPLSTVGQINGYVSSITGTVSTGASYYWFYNWSLSTGCESARVPVDAIINGSITIDAGPVSQALCSEGSDVTFTVSATGAIDSYQWRKGGINIPGATSAAYQVVNASAADAGSYDVVVSGPCATATSNVATLTFNAPAAITVDPVSQEICPGGTATFSATASGFGSLGYQWRKGGVNIPGAYGSSLTISNASVSDVAVYDVVVTGGCNQVTSAAASLSLGSLTAITTQPAAQIVCAGDNTIFTVAATGTGTIHYQWRKAGVNIPGATSSTYTITGTTAAHAGNYDVVVTGDCGPVVSAVAGLDVNAATVISSQPVGQSTCTGSSVTFSVVATGSGALTYQWRKAGLDIPGAVSSTYTINAATAADIASYDVIVTGACGAIISAPAALTISSPGTWIGIQSADWNTAANWCGTIPTSATDITIPAYAPFMPVLTNSGSVKNIIIQSGASLTISSGGVLNLYGNISGAGTLAPAAGTIAFRGATAQSVPAFTAANVIMNGAGGFTLAGSTVITGSLTLTSGNITLGAYSLTLGSGSTGSSASHIITNGTGGVVVAGLAASSSRTIPVGISASSYTPVILAANAGHQTDDLTVKVQEHVLNNGLSGNQLTSFVVDRTWLIDEKVPGGSNVNVTLQWNETDELPQFGRNESYVMQYSGSAWVTGTEAYALGSDLFSQTKSNVTVFSPLAVQTDPLPAGASMQIFPNPVRSTLSVIVRTNAPEQLTVTIVDPSGKIVRKESRPVGFGGTLIGIDASGLSAGIYILKVSTQRDREFLVKRFLKVN